MVIIILSKCLINAIDKGNVLLCYDSSSVSTSSNTSEGLSDLNYIFQKSTEMNKKLRVIDYEFPPEDSSGLLGAFLIQKYVPQAPADLFKRLKPIHH